MIFLAVLLLSFSSYGQVIEISGTVTDADSQEGLFGANIFEINSGKGVISKAGGKFQLQVNAQDSVFLRISNIGYQTQYLSFVSKADTSIQLSLRPDTRQLDEVVVSANVEDKLKYTPYSGLTYMKSKDIRNMVGLLGEPDVIRALQLRPGVQSGGEGTSGMLVRGSTPDQNLVLFEGAPIYNPNHLFGLFSVFDANAIEDVTLYKGAFPAQYGGRIASVLEVKVRDGNEERMALEGGVGLMNSRLTLDGPLFKGKVRYLLSGRMTYFNLITRKINEANADKEGFSPIPDYGFQDFLGKLSYQPNKNNTLELTGYQGRDRFIFHDDRLAFQFLWGNRAASLRWGHHFKNNQHLTQTFTYTNYRYRLRNTFEGIEREMGSGISDLGYKVNFSLAPSPRHRWNMGVELTHHRFQVLRKSEENVDGDINFQKGQADVVKGLEAGIYVSDRWQIHNRLSLESGLRMSGFKADERTYTKLEPRLSLRWEGVPDKLVLKAGYSQAAQYVHLVNSSGMSLPANFWYPSNLDIKPQLAEQYALGLEWEVSPQLQFKQELYYRYMENQLDFREGAELFGNPEVIGDLTRGRGWAYGSEWMLEKTKGSLTGWVAYTLAWSYRQFSEINDGDIFPATNDRRHDITVVLQQKISDHWSLSANWVFASGNVTTMPESAVYFQSQPGGNELIIPYYHKRNTVRLPAYHRADIAFNYKFFPRWGEGSVQLGVYNVYSRRNPYFMYFEQLPSSNAIPKFEARQVSLFPILPSIGFSFKVK